MNIDIKLIEDSMLEQVKLEAKLFEDRCNQEALSADDVEVVHDTIRQVDNFLTEQLSLNMNRDKVVKAIKIVLDFLEHKYQRRVNNEELYGLENCFLAAMALKKRTER